MAQAKLRLSRQRLDFHKTELPYWLIWHPPKQPHTINGFAAKSRADFSVANWPVCRKDVKDPGRRKNRQTVSYSPPGLNCRSPHFHGWKSSERHNNGLLQ